MELKVISKEKGAAEIEFAGAKDTVMNAMISELLRDPNVELVTHQKKHPARDIPRLFVKAKDGKPVEAVARAAKKLAKDITELKKAMEEQKA